MDPNHKVQMQLKI